MASMSFGQGPLQVSQLEWTSGIGATLETRPAEHDIWKSTLLQ